MIDVIDAGDVGDVIDVDAMDEMISQSFTTMTNSKIPHLHEKIHFLSLVIKTYF